MARILVVDDDVAIREACQAVLEREGHEVQTAHNRPEGMESAMGQKPDLLILDVMMEEADDGFVMARELRTRGFSNPIILLTSLGRVTGHEYGADGDLVPVDAFLEKPVGGRLLLDTVSRLLGR